MEVKQWVKIPDVLFFQEGPGVRNSQYTEEGIKLLNVANLVDGKIDLTTSNRYISESEAYGKYKHFLCDDGDFIVASSGIKVEYINKKMGFVTKSMLPLCMNTSTIRFKVLDKSRLNIKYFMYYLKSQNFKNQLYKYITGSAQLNFGPSHLKKIIFPLCDIGEQKIIVNNMDLITKIMDSYNEQLEKYDELIKARFIEMFGDPVADTKNWGQTLLKEHLESIKYGTSTPPIFTDDGYAFIRATNIKNGKIVTNDMKYIPQEEADRLEKCKLSGGEIIIVRSGVNAGDTCVVTDEYIGQYAGYDMILVLSSDLHPVFFNTLINTEYMDKVVKPLTRRAAQPHLNSEQTQRLPIIEVPFELQEQFADFVKQVDKSRFDIKKSITEIEREVVYD